MDKLNKTFVYEPEEFNFIYRQFSVESIIRLFNQNKLILNECKWSTRKCSLFIESILTRIPLDFFYVDHTSEQYKICLLYTSPSPRDISGSRMPSSA